LTLDRGKELSAHAASKVEPAFPSTSQISQSWQRGPNENTNGLLPSISRRAPDLSRWSANELDAVANALNTRPRKTLKWITPAEALDEHLRSIHIQRCNDRLNLPCRATLHGLRPQTSQIGSWQMRGSAPEATRTATFRFQLSR